MIYNKTLNRTTLKIIAAISMTVDHIGAFLIYPIYVESCMVNGVEMMGDLIPAKARLVYGFYVIFRILGRLAFPIFAFMIVEGFQHTHNLKRYLWRLLLFAAISEIPYDLANTNCILDFGKQNVLWTFIIAIIMLCTLEKYALKRKNKIVRVGLTFTTVLIATICAILSDGGIGGIFLIASMYLFRKEKKSYWLATILSLFIMTLEFKWIQLFAIFALVLLKKYNGQKGKSHPYFFYIFYPAHLIILWFVSLII